MEPAPFYWDELLDFVTRERRLVPIVGEDLLVLPNHDGETCATLLAKQLAERLQIEARPAASLSDIAATALQRGRRKADITRELNALHRDFLAGLTVDALPEPLRLLAAIRDFPLFVSTTPDGLLAAALRAETGNDAAIFSSSLNITADLPRDWQSPGRPALIQLFGQITATPGFALTEEDTVEFMCRLQSSTLRPEVLFDELRKRHLLFLGNRFPDWLGRFFLRALKGARFSEETETIEALVEDRLQGELPFVLFLKNFSRHTWLYEDGTTLDFVRELHRRWQSTRRPPEHPSTAPGGGGPVGPEEMPAGAIFISYSSGDRSAAERIAAGLNEAGLDVWLDRGALKSGDRYESKIRRHITQCDLFLPLLSRETETREEAFFRREWAWALARAEGMDRSRRFIRPLCVDPALTPYAMQRVPEEFLKLHIGTALNGELPPELTVDLVKAVREIRSRRIS